MKLRTITLQTLLATAVLGSAFNTYAHHEVEAERVGTLRCISPDLTITKAKVRLGTLRVTVKNIGKRNAGQFKVRTTQGNQSAFNVVLNGLAAGQTVTTRFRLSRLDSPEAQLNIKVDSSNAVRECNENNNTAVAFTNAPFVPPVQ